MGSRAVDLDHIRRDVEFIRRKQLVYAVLVGDMGNFIGPLDPRFDPNNADEGVLNAAGGTWMYQCKLVADVLRPIRHKLICACAGNHDENIDRRHGFNPTYQIWSMLGLDMRHCADYLGLMSQRLLIQRGSANNVFRVDMLLHHGRGSARTAGAQKNVLKAFMDDFTRWDVYMMGHSHNKDFIEAEEPMPNELHTDTKLVRRVGIRSGSYKLSYKMNERSWEENKLFKPATLGCLGVSIKLTHKNSLNEHPDIRVWDIACEPDIDDYYVDKE